MCPVRMLQDFPAQRVAGPRSQAAHGGVTHELTQLLYDRNRLVVMRSKFLLVEGPLQNQGGVIHVRAVRISALSTELGTFVHMISIDAVNA